jgi:RNA polymerase sigma factor (sigma-70 family)
LSDLPSPDPRGDTKQLMIRLIPALRAFARTLHQHPSDADDLVQETLVKAIANIGQYEAGTRLKSWLFTIMRNTFYTRIKTYQRELPGLLECASSRLVAEPSQEWRVRSLEVDAAIRRLPEGQREVIVLVGLLGISYEEAAEICGCAVGTIKSRLGRARLRLLEELGERTSQGMFDRASYGIGEQLAQESASSA